MAKPSLSDLSSLPDPLMSYQFALFLTLPNGIGAATKQLTLRCKTATIPGIQNEEVTVALYGAQVKFAGRNVYPMTLQVTYLETRDTPVRTIIRSWIEYARNVRQNTGNYKVAYAQQADLVLYDDQENVIQTTRVYGIWPTQLSEPNMDGGQSAETNYDVTFAYDYHAEI